MSSSVNGLVVLGGVGGVVVAAEGMKVVAVGGGCLCLPGGIVKWDDTQ